MQGGVIDKLVRLVEYLAQQVCRLCFSQCFFEGVDGGLHCKLAGHLAPPRAAHPVGNHGRDAHGSDQVWRPGLPKSDAVLVILPHRASHGNLGVGQIHIAS